MIAFLSPLFLAGALAAAIPIVLHLFRREPDARVKFAAVSLLRRAPVEHATRRRVQQLLLLALRVSALLLLALAFARPLLTSGAVSASSGVTVVALDTSLSLSAPGQFARAQQLGRDAIRRAPAGDLVGVVTFADAAEVAAAPSADRALATSAVDAASAGVGATRYRAALDTAAGMLEGRRASIVVVTDLQRSGWNEGDRASLPESVRLELADVGEPPPNLAVTSVRASPDRIVATVRNAGPEPRDARVRLDVDGRAAGEAAATIGPHQSAEVTLGGARGASAAVSVEDREGIQADNVRYAVLDNARLPAILVVTASGDLSREGFYVRHALTAAGPDGAAYQVEGVGAAQLSTWAPARIDRYPVVIVLSTSGLERGGRALLGAHARQGGGVLLAAGPGVDPGVAADALAGAISIAMPAAADRERDRALAPADARHPVLRRFGPGTLGLVTFRRIATVHGAACSPLARFTTGEAALVECAIGGDAEALRESGGRALVIASDLDNAWNDFPLHTAFVPFLHEAVRYLAGERTRAQEYLVGGVPPDVPGRPGVAERMPSAGGGAPSLVAVNVDPAESDSARLTADEFQAAVTRVDDVTRGEAAVGLREQEDRQHLWQYLIVMMIAMLVLESFVGARTA